MDVPSLTTAQMVEVDRLMIEHYRIGLIQMMENAGRHLAHLARDRFLSGDPRGSRVTVLAGSGGNGGGALTAARRLHSWGATVELVLGKPLERLGEVPRRQLEILGALGIEVAAEPGDTDVVLDGLIGYSLSGAPHGRVAELIEWSKQQSAPVLSLDVPSGIDATTGEAPGVAVLAAATLTLALPKAGLLATDVGELYLADISVPPQLYETLGLQVGPIFAQQDLLRL